MFNGYIAQKRLQQACKTEQVMKKQSSIRKRYQTEIQPLLLKHYKKRITKFIQKMNTNPIIINPQNLLPPIKELPHFTFRDASDWRTIETTYKQDQRTVVLKLGKSNQARQRCRTLNNQFYSNYRHQYRSREKDKQLQPAMRFKSIQKFKEIRKKQHFSVLQVKNKQAQQPKQRGDNFSRLRETSNTVSNNSTTNKNQDEEEIQFLVNRERNDIELEARKYQKQRQPSEKKLHFKKIADLALRQKDELQRKDLRQILRKSGYSKVKRMNFLEMVQTDNFTALVQKVANK